MNQIKTYEEYTHLVEWYNRRGRMTNNYLQNVALDLIIQGKLFAVYGQKNVALLVQKDGFIRLYYYLNDVEERLLLPEVECVTEILFRCKDAPETEVDWLEKMGFKKNLIREQYYAKYVDLTTPTLINGLKIDIATAEEDALWAIELFNASFDKWSGDYLPNAIAPLLIKDQAILIAKDLNDNRIGSLHFGKEKGVTWLHHLAVVENARGMGVGLGLVDAFIEQGHVDDNSRYLLWVQRQNMAAVNLYKKKGFTSLNKSTLSMIKL